MADGRRTGPPRTLETAKTLFRADLEHVPEEARRIEAPVAPTPRNSDALENLAEQATADARRRAGLS
jgi:hypothetical protein